MAVELENLEVKFNCVVDSPEWKALECAFAKTKNVLFFGNGGNMSIADHGAIDICRLTDKHALCPGSGIVCSSVIGDTSFTEWLKTWVEYKLRSLCIKETIALGLSCSSTGNSSDSVIKGLSELADKSSGSSFLISATKKDNLPENIINIVLGTKYYHTSEILSTILFYQLIHSAGFKCPEIR